MALKFQRLQEIAAPSRRLADEPKDGTIKYEGLSVPIKIVELEGGVKGAVTLDRWAKMKSAIVEDAEGFATLPDGWKVGRDKAGIGFGYWYDSNELTGTGKAELDLG